MRVTMAVASIICILFFASSAWAAVDEQTIKYAGTTAGSATWNPPSFDNDAQCSKSSDSSPYVLFNVTYSSPGVREVAGMAEQSFKGELSVFIYAGSFNPSMPCQNLLGQGAINQFGSGNGGPVLDDFYFFQIGIYIFVVTGGSTGGIFAINIFPSLTGGQTAGNPIWPVPEDYDDEDQCDYDTTSANEYYANYASYSFVQQGSGYYDIYVLFVNDTVKTAFASRLLFFQGTPNVTGLGNDPCNNNVTGAILQEISVSDSKGTYIPYVYLADRGNYTIAFSTFDLGTTGYYGIQIIPTRIRFQQPTAFIQPNRDFFENGCSASSASTSWDSTLFLTENRAYIIDTGDAPPPFESFDTYSFLYRGSNLGSSNYPPTTCPIFSPLVYEGDTGDITPLAVITDPGVNYTVVVSTYSSSGNYTPTTQNPYAYVLYLFTGTPIGSLPPSSSSTGATDSGSTTTATGTGTGVNTGTGSTTAQSTTTAQASTSSTSTTAKTTSTSTTSAASTSTSTSAKTTSTSTTAKTTSTSTTAAATTGRVSSTTSGAAASAVASVFILFAVTLFVLF